MTPEQQRIAIAEACGWTRKNVDLEYPLTRPEGRWEKEDKVVYHPGQLPNYLNDLNAMHEAEKILTPEQHQTYRRTQFEIATRVAIKAMSHLKKDRRCQLFYQAAIAPCHTHAEAFLRTLNLYIS